MMLKKILLSSKNKNLIIFSIIIIIIPGFIIFSIRIKPEKKIYRVIRIINNRKSDWEINKNNKQIIKNIINEEGFTDSYIRIQKNEKVTIYNISKKNKYDMIPVFTFHSISDNKLISISKKNFENFLLFLKRNNFYFLSPDQIINKDFTHIPNGKKLCLLTADDASLGQFVLKKKNNKYYIDSNSMLGIINKHIDDKYMGKINFTFFVSFDGVPFGQEFLVRKKLNYISDNYYIGNHTQNHYYMKNLLVDEFKNEIDLSFKSFEYYLGEKYKKVKFLAYPYGVNEIPKKYRKILDNYNYKNHKLLGGFDCVGDFTITPYSKKFDKWDMERIAVDNNNIKYVKMDLEFSKIYVSERMKIFVYNDKKQNNFKDKKNNELEYHIYPIF